MNTKIRPLREIYLVLSLIGVEQFEAKVSQ